MGRDEHIQLLKKSVDEWNRFRADNISVRPSLVSADLAGSNLSGADLSDTDLTDANLENAQLTQANLQRAKLYEANLTAVEAKEVDLRQADLRYANLQNSKLQGGDLQGANLERAVLLNARLDNTNLSRAKLRLARLQGANFTRAELSYADIGDATCRESDFSGAKLRSAIFCRAILRSAVFEGADLLGADFRGSDLRDVDISKTDGLMASNLGGADVSNAKLPSEIKEFEGLEFLQKLSENARRHFVVVLLACGYSLLSIFSTSDLSLLTNAPAAFLPNVNVPFPTISFYLVIPGLLLCLYLYFQFHLQRVWSFMADLPAVFPDGRSIDKVVYPWLPNTLARTYSDVLKEQGPVSLGRLEVPVVKLLIWWAVPLTLVAFWWRYLRLQDPYGTSWQALLAVLSLWAACNLQKLTKNTISVPTVAGPRTAEELEVPARLFMHIRDHYIWDLIGERIGRWVPFATQTLGRVSLVARAGTEWTGSVWMTLNGWLRRKALIIKIRRLYLDHYVDLLDAIRRARVPIALASSVALLCLPLTDWGLMRLGVLRPRMNISRLEVSIKTTNWDEKTLAGVAGADLTGQSLRFALASGVYLVRAELAFCDLRFADLRDADLREADLREALLDGAEIGGADLTGARNLTQAQIEKAKGDASTLMEGLKRPKHWVVGSLVERR